MSTRPGVSGAAWYCFKSRWRRQRGSYAIVVLLVGVLGGLSLGSIAGARRTASSFSTYFAATNPSDLTIVPLGGPPGYSTRLEGDVEHLPDVTHVESYVALDAAILRSGRVPARQLDSAVIMVGSVDGLLFNQDRIRITSGRMANPTRANEIMLTQAAAAALHLHVGQSITVVLTPSGSRPQATRRVRLHIVGVGVLNREVVQDQIARFPTYLIATPALTRSSLADVAIAYYGVQVRGGAALVPSVERSFTSAARFFTDFEVASNFQAQAEQAIKPEALALGVFGGIAGLAALFLAMQAVVGLLRSRDDEQSILRAVGAGTTFLAVDGLLGVLGVLLLGSMLSVGVAVALSPLAPTGPARAVYPDRGFNADWTVLGIGIATLFVALGTAAGVTAYQAAPHRRARHRPVSQRQSATVQLVRRSGLPVAAVAGAQFALERTRNRSDASTRWALLGAVVAMIVVAATLTFGSSLHTLVSQPRLYGWNWDYAVQSSDGYGPVPNAAVARGSSNPAVLATSGVWFATLELDGIEVPLLLAYPNAKVSPPVLEGHAIQAPNQIVVGAATLAQLHKHIGDTVALSYAPHIPSRPFRLVIVGVATMPAIGIAESLHTSIGIGAIVPANSDKFTERLGPNAYPGCNGPNMVFLRVRGGVGSPSGLAAAKRIATLTNTELARAPKNSSCGGNVASVLSVQHPAQIVNYRSMGTTPVLLAGGLAGGALVALGVALISSVRRRRRDLAVLRTLGFRQGQLAAAISWQASIAAVAGAVFGLPLGALLGRWLWTLFAREIGVVPSPTVPVWWLVVAGVAAIVLSNGVAALPGRSAARTTTSVLLHEE